MPIPWALINMIPWTDVIDKAPTILENAKKLWSTVAKKNTPALDTDSNALSTTSSESQSIAALEERAIALETAVSDLQSQMLASSVLIKTLADQNAQLIQRIETNRRRLLLLSAATSVVAVVALLSLLRSI